MSHEVNIPHHDGLWLCVWMTQWEKIPFVIFSIITPYVGAGQLNVGLLFPQVHMIHDCYLVELMLYSR